MTSAEAIIAKMGGTRRAAQLLGIPPSTVQSWKVSGVIPARRQAMVLEVARSQKIHVEAVEFMSACVAAQCAP